MTAKKYFVIALFIGLQAAILQAVDQAICGGLAPLVAGGGWISFQAWAMYFLGGCTPKGAARVTCGYILGMIASIAIMMLGGALGGLGFWAMPLTLLILVPLIMYLEITPELINFTAALFVGAGVFFGIMSYAPGATFGSAFVGELIYCVIGLACGFCTVTFRGWYEPRYDQKHGVSAK